MQPSTAESADCCGKCEWAFTEWAGKVPYLRLLHELVVRVILLKAK